MIRLFRKRFREAKTHQEQCPATHTGLWWGNAHCSLKFGHWFRHIDFDGEKW